MSDVPEIVRPKTCPVLVVDDNPDALLILSMLRKMERWETRTAIGGQLALIVIREFKPEIILLDLGLPGMNRHDVCRTVKESLCPPIVIAVTGRSDSHTRDIARDAGFDDHLVKPVEFKRLLETMD